MVKDHWDSFPRRTSYCGRDRLTKEYFKNPDLSVRKLFSSFQEYFLKSTGTQLSMRYPTYFNFFRLNCSYSFILPRTDVCDFCTECETLLAANSADPCKIFLLQHKDKVKQYESLKEEYLVKLKTGSLKDTLILEFDYGQNLALPKLNVPSQFHKRLLWFYIFNIHCHNDNSSFFYHFLEVDAKKNYNSVCSFLYDFASKKLLENRQFKAIILFSSSCREQNKNITMTRFCSWFAKVNEVEIFHIFSVRGHSYSQCDINFGSYGNRLKKVEKVENADEYISIINSCREKVVEAANLIEDWCEALSKISLKSPTSEISSFSLQQYVKLQYLCSGDVCVYTTYDENTFQTFKIFEDLSQKSKTQLGLKRVNSTGISEAKKKDLLSLMRFLTPESQKWYDDIFDKSKVIYGYVRSDDSEE